MIHHKDMTTPSNPAAIFVFGSNTLGLHYGGSAQAALLRYGAEMGVGVGRTGQSYAIPSCVAPGGAEQQTLEAIQADVYGLIDYARENPELEFFITRIGCGVAGFTDEQIAPLFTDAVIDELNFDLPEEWVAVLADADPAQNSAVVDVANRTNTLPSAWEEIEGPCTGVGAEHWFRNLNTSEEVYVCYDQGELVAFSCE